MQSHTESVHDAPRDRVTGVPADGPPPGRRLSGLSSDEIEQEIRKTRGRISASLDEIEGRLAPARIKDEVRSTIRQTIDDVREDLSPKRMAKQAQATMIETIKDHPLPALTAGLSIGYLLLKAGENSGERYSGDTRARRRPAFDEPERGYGASRVKYPEQVPAADRPAEYEPAYRGDEEGRSLKHRAEDRTERARERAEDAREQADEWIEDTSDRARRAVDETRHRTRQVGRQLDRRARSAGTSVEHFIYDNPLAAGALAVGVGALLGGLFPSTRVEDEWFGPARDEAVGKAKRVAEETLDSGKDSARRVAEEAQDAARDVADTARSEAREVGETARRRASDEMGKGDTSNQRSAERSSRPPAPGTPSEDGPA